MHAKRKRPGEPGIVARQDGASSKSVTTEACSTELSRCRQEILPQFLCGRFQGSRCPLLLVRAPGTSQRFQGSFYLADCARQRGLIGGLELSGSVNRSEFAAGSLESPWTVFHWRNQSPGGRCFRPSG